MQLNNSNDIKKINKYIKVGIARIREKAIS